MAVGDKVGRVRWLGVGIAVCVACSPLAMLHKASGSPARTKTGHPAALLLSRDRTSAVAERQGRRVFSAGVAGDLHTTNWSGYGGLVPTTIGGAEGTWTVPAVAASSASLLSASWVGIDGYIDSPADPTVNSWLIQTGTEQDTSNAFGGHQYYAWWEIITPTDRAPQTFINGPVTPGDVMHASVTEKAAGTWEIVLDDTTADWFFDQTFAYAGPGESAEWIEEAPSIGATQSTPADWGETDFSTMAVYDGTQWSSTALTSDDAIDLVDRQDHVLAYPGPLSAPSGSGQSFADIFGAPPAPPPTVPPTVPPTAPPTVPPTSPPTVPPTAPPTVPPTAPPTAPQTVPQTAPPTVPPPTVPRTTPTVPPAPPGTTNTTLPSSVKRPGAPSAPTRIAVRVRVRAVRLTWHPPTRNGGAQVVLYRVKVYTAGRVVRTIYTRSLVWTVRGLLTSRRYTFTIAAFNGYHYSAPSAKTKPVRPRA